MAGKFAGKNVCSGVNGLNNIFLQTIFEIFFTVYKRIRNEMPLRCFNLSWKQKLNLGWVGISGAATRVKKFDATTRGVINSSFIIMLALCSLTEFKWSKNE